MPRNHKKTTESCTSNPSQSWGRRAALTFHGGGEDDEVVIEELSVLNEGQAGVICGLEGELKGPVWRRKEGVGVDGQQRNPGCRRRRVQPPRVFPTPAMPSPRRSPFRLRKNIECVSRTLRLSSSTRVRGPLAQTQASAASSNPQRDQARVARRGSIFIFQPERRAPGYRKCPSRPPNGRSRRWSITWKWSGYSVAPAAHAAAGTD